jgi:acyl-coenzyme A thioesterase PaaI-like protein
MNWFKHPEVFRHIVNIWPPFLGAGIRVTRISKDWRKITVRLRMHALNRNYVGTHFGGSLFAMTDPFYMLMLIHLLGKGYRVWDKTATIEFVKPVRGAVSADFEISRDRLSKIVARAADGNRLFEPFSVDVKDRAGEVVARVRKTIYIRKTSG